MTHPLYLDYAATTPMAPEVALAMAQCLTLEGDFANPASLQHSLGERAYHLVETARSDIAELLNCKANDLVFTSGATEANNLALKGLAFSPQNTRKHIVTSATEHKALKGVHFNGDQQQKLASIINISFDDVGSDSLMIHLKEQIAIANQQFPI